jgi:general secretion pathway protein M
MKAWWQQLNIREQRLVMAMASVMGVFILYSFIWQPLNENLVKAEKKLLRQQALLEWVGENTARYQQSVKGGSSQSKGSLSSIVNRTAKRNNIVITRMQPQGDDLQVWIDEVSFSQLLLWLEQLAANEKLQVKGIDLTRGEKSGAVRVRRLQLGRN